MGRTWTDEQDRAIKRRNANILVSAAAGSGKTAVLVERIIGLIREGASIDNMLVVTFSKAAASEMRERIMLGIASSLSDASNGPDMSAKFRRELLSVGSASIMTLHAFCNDVLNSYFFKLGLSPDLRIGEESDIQSIRAEALEDVLNEAYIEAIGSGDEDFFDVADALSSSGGADDGFRRTVLEIYGFIMTKPNPVEWLDEKAAMHGALRDDFGSSEWVREIMADVMDKVKFAVAQLEAALEICSEDEVFQKYGETISSELESIESAVEGFGDFDRFKDAISSVTFGRLPSIRSKDVDPVLKERVSKMRDSVKKLVSGMKSSLLLVSADISVGHLEFTEKAAGVLAKVTKAFKKRYEELKEEKSLLDYNDLEHKTISLLEFDDVRGGLMDRFDHVFIDEYQDTNEVQEYITTRISRESNRFMVGDIKQSIYRFRLADPDIFTRKYERFKAEKSDVNEVIDLSKNFRSRGEIIDCVNFVFEGIMTKRLGGIDYDDANRLYASDKGFREESPETGFFEVNVVHRGSILEGLGSEGQDAESGSNAGTEPLEELEELGSMHFEALAVAKRIKRLVAEEGFSYSDIAILARSMKKAPAVFSEVFRQEGIPLYSQSSDSYFNTLEIKLMTSLLRVLDNAHQDIHLISLMRSPIGGFDIDEILRVRMFAGMRSISMFDIIYRLYSESKAEKPYSGLDKEFADRFDELGMMDLMPKLLSLYENVTAWKRRAEFTPLDKLIWGILNETNFYHYVCAMPGGKAREANLKLLVERASKYEARSSAGLFNFIKYIESLEKNNIDLDVARVLGEGDDVVRMMTIHKSKGLEFPVVFIVDAGREFNTQDIRKPYAFHKDLGIGMDYFNMRDKYRTPNISTVAIKSRNRLENLSEEMRILYVAMTRPIERLYVYGSLKSNYNLENRIAKWSQPKSVLSLSGASSFLDWICMAVHDEASPYRIKVLGAGDISTSGDGDESRMEAGELKGGDGEDGFDIESLSEMAKDGRFDSSYEAVRERLSYRYPYRASTVVPFKLSVTGLIRASKNAGSDEKWYVNVPETYEKPSCLIGKTKFEAEEIGTIVHKIMQLMPLDATGSAEGVEGAIRDMIGRNAVNIDGLEMEGIVDLAFSFYESDIGKRLVSSKSIRREQPFVISKEVEGEKLLVQGIIDAYFEEDGDIVLVDYKTGGAMFESEADVLEKYAGQILEYKSALESLTGKRVKESFIYMLERKWVVAV